MKRYFENFQRDYTFSPEAPPQSASANTGPLRKIVVRALNRLTAITGKTNWWEAPDTTLATTRQHLDIVNGNPHGVNASQVGAPTTAEHAQKLTTADIVGDHVVSGFLASVPSPASLTMTLTPGVAYVGGNRIAASPGFFAFAASSDTYVDQGPTGTRAYTPVANGAAAPALAANSLRLAKVVTNATQITSVVDLRVLKPTVKAHDHVEADLPLAVRTVKDEGAVVAARRVVNFVGSGVTVSDDGAGEQTQVSIPGGGSGSTPAGHIQDLGYEWVSNTQYRVLPGQALVNGVLVTVSSNITRTPPATANTLFYVYLYSSGGSGAVEESTTAPAWDAALQYWKKGGGAPDATRRCIGFVQTSSTVLRRFDVKVLGRQRDFYYTDGAVHSVLDPGTVTSAWTQVPLSEFVPAHATDWYAIAKLRFGAANNEAILGLHPFDPGSAISVTGGLYVVRDSSPKASTTFFGHNWQPVGPGPAVYYRLSNPTGTNEGVLECNGARFLA